MAQGQPDSVTRGFLFADLRGYTEFAETHGAAAAAALLGRFRSLARDAIGRFGGAEIKTEGDSFFVAFGSVSGAVRCGLALTAAAASDSAENPDEPIRVGVGIHAGETVEAEGGYVGSPVNIAARICAQAGAGEVVVSETVRALTRAVLPVAFKSRGRRELKGIAEPIELFSVVEVAAGAAAWTAPRRRTSRKRAVMIAGVAVALIGAAAIGWRVIQPPAGLPPGAWTIGLNATLTGPGASLGIPLRNAVQLAIDQANEAGGIGGVQLAMETYDDAAETSPFFPDPDRGATNASSMVNDPRTIAMIGPYGSEIAYAIIPITNEAGLLQCSPSNTLPELTKPDHGALEVRSAYPERINYIRLAPSDDIQAPALADFATHDLEAESALVVDDTDIGVPMADGFVEAFTELGGQVIRSSFAAGADPMTALEPLASDATPPDVVFFSGLTNTGAPELRRAMVEAGHAATPYLGWDPLINGSGAVDGSYLQVAGPAAAGTFATHASIAPPRADFVEAFRAAFGEEPNEYAAAAYACMEVVLDSLRGISASGPDAVGLREALRAYAVDPAHRYQTTLGTLGFDANGDSTQQFVSFYRVDPAAADDAGDWVVLKQQDYGPAP